jgi:hypothetical protein
MVLNDAFVSFDGNDLSAYVKSVSLPYAAEMLDDTAMGDDTRKNKGGLKTWSAEIEFKQDFADGLLDELMFPLVGTTGTLLVRPSSDDVGASNPEYTGVGVLESYPPLGNGVGELATTTATIQSAGTLTREVT